MKQSDAKRDFEADRRSTASDASRDDLKLELDLERRRDIWRQFVKKYAAQIDAERIERDKET